MFWKTSNNAAGDTFSLGDQLHLVDWMWVQAGSELDEGTTLSEEWEVDACVVLGGDGVDDKVKFGIFAGHGLCIFRDNKEIGALLLSHLLFGSGS